MAIVYTTADGVVLQPGAQFSLAHPTDGGSYNFPANWLDHANSGDFTFWRIAVTTVADPPAPSPLIPTISKAQALLWLLSVGKTEADVLAAIDTISDATQKAVALIEWKYREPFHRAHPMFNALAPALGLTPSQLDAAFTAAALM